MSPTYPSYTIAVDTGALFHVGPESVGSDPGPSTAR
jgi:N-methylhydantoinase A/oxoprolinase/acetone carboxylase beta subunit